MALVSIPVSEEMFLTTPVENLFIHEVMGAAPGDYVKVYLYGLMLCHHPAAADMTVEEMAQTLHMPTEDVRKAFFYWARRHLVEVTEEPFSVKYLSVQQHINESRQLDDLYRLEPLFEKITALIGPDVQLKRTDLESVYDWMEGLGLDSECVLALVENCVLSRKGSKKNLMAYMNATANEWSRLGITTADAASAYLRREDAVAVLCSDLIKRWGIGRKASHDEESLASKWLYTWQMEPACVIQAARRMQATRPGFKYLDTMLTELHGEGITKGEEADAYYNRRETESAEVKEILKALGYFGPWQAELPQSLYREWKKAGYPHNAVVAAARQLARRGSSRLEDLNARLTELSARGMLSEESLASEEARIKEWGEGFSALLKVWNESRAPRETECRRYGLWIEQGHAPSTILSAAREAVSARDRLSYMDRILADWKNRGITQAPTQKTPSSPSTSSATHFGYERAPEQEDSGSIPDWDAPL